MKELGLIGVDIGSYKISVTSAFIDNEGDIQIIKSYTEISKGIEEGLITNEKELSDILIPLLEKAIESLKGMNYIIELGLSSRECRITYDTLTVKINNGKILPHHIKYLINNQNNKVLLRDNEIIVQTILLDYVIDGKVIKENVVGWKCKELGANLCYVIGDKNILEPFRKIFIKLGYNIHNFRINIISSRKFFLEDSYGQSLLVDVGRQVTDMCIFNNGNPQEVFCIPLGGDNITKDISMGLGLPFGESENIKQIFSSSYKKISSTYDNRIERVGTTEIDKKLLSEIIYARVEEMIKIIILQLKKQEYYDKIENIVLFGDGLVYFEDIKEISYSICGKKILILSPKQTYLQNSSTISSLAIVKDAYDDLKLIYKNFTIENILTKESSEKINYKKDIVFKFKTLLKEIF